jgi:outer membrane lipase/esterase
MSDNKNKKKVTTAKAVRRALMASAALTPVWMFAPQASAQSVPTVNAGNDQSIPDTDGVPGEDVTLQGMASIGNSGGIGPLTLVWTEAEGGQPIATGATPTVRLPSGVTHLRLTATDIGNSSSASDIVIISVDVAGTVVAAGTLESAARTTNEQNLGRAMDSLCQKITMTSGEGPALVLIGDQNDLRDRCDLLDTANPTQQAEALAALGAQNFNAIRTVAVEFSQTQFQSVMDRLQSLRAGARGVSLAGLTINSGAQVFDGEQVADSLNHAFGGGASADSGLLNERLGFWLRGNVGSGDKQVTDADAGFDADQFGVTGGADLRFGTNIVAGISVGIGETDVGFGPGGGFDSESVAVSLYGSAYLGNLYLDGVLNFIDADYDTERQISYVDAGGPVNRTALGTTSGDTTSGGVGLGYDFIFGGFTLAPNAGYYYVDSSLDAFRETGANGLDLEFGAQDFTSSTANVGLRMSYAWKTSWAVIVPHVRGTFVREFEDEVEVFNVRFANDPFASSADPTPPIAVESDSVDTEYFRLAAGLSLQMKHGFSGYVDYQRIEGFENVSFQDFTAGLRVQISFR